MTCKHIHKTCTQLKYSNSKGTELIDGIEYHYNADVDLWYCKDCNQQLTHDWHTDTWQPLQPTAGKASVT